MSSIRCVIFKVAIALTCSESHGGCMVAIPHRRKWPPKPVWTDIVSFNKFRGARNAFLKFEGLSDTRHVLGPPAFKFLGAKPRARRFTNYI